MSTEFELPELKQAIGRLDDLFATAFSSKDNAMQDWVAVRFAIKAQSAPSNSDYEKCSHVIGLICGVLDITISECDELNLHEIYHKIVEIKNVVKELSQHFA